MCRPQSTRGGGAFLSTSPSCLVSTKLGQLQFSPCIATLPFRPAYEKSDLLVPTFRLHSQGDLAVYYAPFDHVNPDARVVLVGITPGWTQMAIGYREARIALMAGQAMDAVCQQAKAHASFAGPMRRNLVMMLDGIRLPHAISIPSSEALFGPASTLLHTTSVIRYPVFINGENYTGHRPKPLRTPLLRDMIRTLLVEELEQIPDTLVIPLGTSVEEVITDLARIIHQAWRRRAERAASKRQSGSPGWLEARRRWARSANWRTWPPILMSRRRSVSSCMRGVPRATS